MLLLASSQPLRRFILPGLFVALLFITLWNREPPASDGESGLIALSGQTMGTTFSVKVRAQPPNDSSELISKTILEELTSVVSSMSTYEQGSELSLWNRSETTEGIGISKPLAIVVAAGLLVSEESGGAFDMTVQPLVDLWGFGPNRRTEAPSDAEVQEALANVGTGMVKLDKAGLTLTKSKKGVWLDLSAIAKGYAVDRVSERLSQMGHSAHFVEIGGEVRTRGMKTDQLPWRIGVESPKANGSVRLSLPLKDQAIATSGSYRNFRKYGAKTFSHTLDPRTGRPVTHKLVSVSVVHTSCMLADAWATALSVLGPQKGLELAQKLKLAASFVFLDKQGELTEHQTLNFRSFVTAAKLPTPEAGTE
jgi:FAD:protein FMN transferase